MAGIIPLPTSRISNSLVRERLLSQLQSDQLDLFRLQNQVSTGRRITVPSEDPAAARRAMTLQRLLERKQQLAANVGTGQSFLKSTDVALNDVATLLGDLRGTALGVAGTTSTDAERQGAATAVSQAIEQLLATANTQFRGRYLFAGSQTNVVPYTLDGNYVRYNGDGRSLNSYFDLGVMFSSNAAGLDVFGGLSAEVVGSVNVSPQLSDDTLLSSLRNGRGISPNGALQISDGTNTSVVDISKAVTIGDVIRQIEAHPPAGRVVNASINGRGITLQLDAAGGGNLTVTEVGSGTAAGELGILNTTGALTNPLVGTDLQPTVLKTTRLEDLIGTRASARLVSAGNDNDLLIEAAQNGAQYNGATIQLVDDAKRQSLPTVVPGSEFAQYRTSAQNAQAALEFTGTGNDLILTANLAGTAYNNVTISVVGASGLGDNATAVYDSVAKHLTITVDDAGATSVGKVEAAINSEGTFTAAHDASAEGAAYDGTALINAADISTVTGDTGNSGGAANTLYVYVAAGKSTAKQIAAAINAEGTFRARTDSLDASSGSEAGNKPASINAMATASGGSGAALDKSSGIQITNGGNTYTVTFAAAETVEDLLNTLNGSDADVFAEINADGTGINVHSRLSGADLQIGENGGSTATQLGIRSFTGQTRLDQLNYGVGVPTKRDGLQGAPAVVNDFTIVATDGTGPVNIDIDASSAGTVQDVLDLINNSPQNNTGGIAVVARLTAAGNGIEIVDTNGRPLTINAAEGSKAAEYLGLIPAGNTSVGSPTGTITGTDKNYLQTDSVFNTLVRLKQALSNNDLPAMERAIQGIDADIDRVTGARSDVGAREQALTLTTQNLQDEDVQLRSALSNDLDVDLVEAISNLTARQTSLEASLKTTANILQLSLINFL